MKKNEPEIHMLTEEGYQKLKEELDYRTNTKRPELKVILEEMRNAGDLRENDGFTMAIEDTGANESRIAEIENILANCKIVKENGNNKKVMIGSSLKVKVGTAQKQITIVGESEANPLENKISDKSPIGIALLNKSKGDKVAIETPMGKVTYEIIEIS